MFSSFSNNKDQIHKTCEAVLKLFSSPTQQPKNFFKQEPNLKAFAFYFDTSNFKLKVLQEVIKDKMNKPFELEITLGTELSLNKQIKKEMWEIMTILMRREKKLEPQHENYLFQFVEKLFVQATYQLPKWVNFCNSNPNYNDSMTLENISTILLYFIKFQDMSNQIFYDLLYSFIGLLKVQWPIILYGNSPFLREKLNQIFVCIGQLVQFESQFEKKCCFPFMTTVVSYCIDLFNDFNYDVKTLIHLQRQFIFILDYISDLQKMEMMHLVETFLRIGPTFLRSFSSSLLNLENCLGVFIKCLQSLKNELVISTLQDILEYILWFSCQFPKFSILSPIPLIEIPITELVGIGVPIYSKYAVVLPDLVQFTLFSRFQNVTSEIAAVIQEHSNPQMLLPVLFEFLLKYKPFFESVDYLGPNVVDSIADSDSECSEEKNQKAGKSVKPSEIQNFEKFRILVLVILEVAKSLKVQKIFDFLFENNEQFKNEWVPIIIKYIFPIHKEKLNQGCMNLYNSIIFCCYRDLADKRKLLLNEISYLIDTRCSEAPDSEISLMIEFLPLLNHILINSVYENDIINSNLLKTFIRESKKDVRIFELFSTIIYVYPVQCFTSSQLTGFITEYFDDKIFHNSFVRCLINGLYYCGKQKDSNEIRLLFNHLSAMLPTLFSKKYQQCYDFIDMLAKTLPSFEVENFSLFFKTGIIDLIASSCASVLSKRMFESALNLFTVISRISDKSLAKISNPKSAIYSTFSEIFENNDFNFEIIKWLFIFAIIPDNVGKFQHENYNQTILNPMALTLIFKWIAGRNNEAEIVQILFLMAESHVVNVYQMQKAHIPLLILERVSQVTDDLLAQSYHDLLYTIWRQGVPSSDIYKAVSIMKICRSPQMITDTFNRLLRQEKKKHSVLYYLHGKNLHSGFFFQGISREKPLETLVVSMSILPDNLGTTEHQILLFIQNEKQDTIEFGIENESVYFQYNKNQKRHFQSNLIQNLWYNLTFIINAKCIKMIVIDLKQNQTNIDENPKVNNGCVKKTRKKSRPSSFMDKKSTDLNALFFDKESFSCPNFFTPVIKLRIGRSNLPRNYFTGFMISVMLLDDYLPNEDYTNTVIHNFSSKFLSHVIYILNPRKTRLKESGVKMKRESYRFIGMTFGVYCTIHSVIEETNLMDNILPLYQRLISCDSCQKSADDCTTCKRLNQQRGQQFLVSLTSLIIKFLEMPKITKSNESPKNIIVLLSQFFTNIATIFFTDNFVNTFYAIFEYTQNPNTKSQIDSNRKIELGKKMVELIWLNYEMVSRFPLELQLHYFSIHLMKVFADDEKSDVHLFKSFASYDFLIHKLLLFFTDEDSEVTKIAWQITLECFIKKAITTATASALLGLSFSTETMTVSDSIVSFIEMLTKTGHSTMTAANQSFKSMIPYAIWASRPPVLVQRKTILFIKNNLAKRKAEAEQALFCAAFLYEAPNRGVDLVEFVTYFIGVGRKSFYPLFARILANITREDFEKHEDIIFHYLSPEKSGGVENILYWLVMIAQSIVFLNITEGIKKFCEEIFGKLIINSFTDKKYDMLNTLMYYVTLFTIENDINMDIIIETTIISLINHYNQKKKEKTPEITTILFEAAFTHLFVKKIYDVSFSNENNIFTVYADHICTFTINFTISAMLKECFENEREIDLVLMLVQFMSIKPFQVNLFDAYEISSTELIAYALLKLCNTPDIKNIIKGKSSIDDLVKKFVSSLSGHSQSIDNSKLIISNYKCKATSKIKKSEGTDPSNFLNEFEASMRTYLPIYSQKLHTNCETIIKEVRNYLTRKMNLNIDSKPPDPEKSQKLDYFTYAINSDSFKMLFNMYKKYRQNMTEKHNLNKSVNAKVLTVFMRNLQVRCGPWFKPGETNYHFKSAKMTGKTGYRSLMRINTQFDVNKTNATIEDKLKPLIAPSPGSIGLPTNMVTPRYKYIGSMFKFAKGFLFIGEFTNFKKRRIDIYYKSIIYVFARTLSNGADACEIFLENSKSYLFEMPIECREILFKNIDEFHNSISSSPLATAVAAAAATSSSSNISSSLLTSSNIFINDKFNFFKALQNATGSIVQRVPSTELFNLMKLSEAWEKRQISNYAYIYYLNILAGRSFNDLSQYPVYPWVISDYESKTINLTTPETFRDLSKATCNMHKPFQFSVGSSSITSHFSNPYIVLNYLRLIEPFASIGKNYKTCGNSPPFFSSISETWSSVRKMKSDNRELIPEFFTNDFFLAATVDSKIELPPWAKNDPANFVRINRAALESEYVRHKLPKWIDLMFGVNINSSDIFNQYPTFSYHGFLSKDSRSACFGICPQQVLLQPQSQSSTSIIEFKAISSFPVKNVVRMRRGFVLTDDFNVITTSDSKKVTVPPMSNIKFVEASKETQTIFYASPFESYFTGFRIGNASRPIMVNHDAALIQSIAVIGSYVVSGSNEGSIKRWNLPEFDEYPMTNYHCCPVIAIGGSDTLNLLVSLDANAQLVYETISHPVFLRAVKLEFEAAVKNFIAVFKCGMVVVVQSGSDVSVITLLDLAGNVLSTRKYNAHIQECDKFTSKSRSATIVVGYSSDTIEQLELPSLKTAKLYHGLIPNMRFCVSKGSKNAVEAFTGTEIKLIPLSSIK